MKKHLAVVPAYNEEASVARVVEDVNAHAPDFDVLVVDDGSTDGTAAAARQAGAIVISHPFNLGIGGAVQSGYRYALAHGYGVAVQVDGDHQHDARHIPEMLVHLERDPELDLVTGSRFLEHCQDAYRSSGPRRLGIRLFAALLTRLTGRRVTDPTSGFRITGRRGIELFARHYPADYPEVEAVLIADAHDLGCAEIPVTMRPRAEGLSSITMSRSALYMAKVLLAVLMGALRGRPAAPALDRLAVAEVTP
jgi:glycosyltransferase involved in cell wall biosynthesis